MSEAIFSRLKAPFAENEIEWRVGQAGTSGKDKDDKPKVWCKVLAYVTNRAIMDRLDEVVGADNWQNQYATIEGGFLCGISIRIGNEWVTKWDGADRTDIEAIKGGLSGAQKRAAVNWGIGRYLYDLEEGFATVFDEKDRQGQNYAKTKDGVAYRWNPPKLPGWAVPKKQDTKSETPKAEAPAVARDMGPFIPQGVAPKSVAPTFKQQLTERLKAIGCKTKEDAETVVRFATDSKFKTVAEYAATADTATSVLTSLDMVNATGIPDIDILKTAKECSAPAGTAA